MNLPKHTPCLYTLVLILFSCTSAEKAQAPSPLSLQVVQVRKKTTTPTLETFGVLSPTKKVDVYPTQEGIVEELLVEEGTWVEQGQVLARLSREKLLLSREQAKNALAIKEALLALAEEKLTEGERAVEVRLLTLGKVEADYQQRNLEHSYALRLYEAKRQLHEAGGISSSELESVYQNYLKTKSNWEQASREVELQKIGLRDSDLVQAGYSTPLSPEDRKKACITLGTQSLRQQLKVAQGEVELAKTELKRIELLLKETEIRSPIQGKVKTRHLEVGEKASPDSLIFSLYATDSLYAQFEVGERDLPLVTLGQKAEVLIEQAGGEWLTLSGSLHLLSPYLQSPSRAIQARVLLDLSPQIRAQSNKKNFLFSLPSLLPGRFVRIRLFIGEKRESLWIPKSSLLPEGTVFLVRDSCLFKSKVRLGISRNGELEVLEGLKEGDRVVVHPTPFLREGETIQEVE
ncbi:MAG: efflux RND transporter periplasmic adaptor subunit [Spirochaetales bacterium]